MGLVIHLYTWFRPTIISKLPVTSVAKTKRRLAFHVNSFSLFFYYYFLWVNAIGQLEKGKKLRTTSNAMHMYLPLWPALCSCIIAASEALNCSTALLIFLKDARSWSVRIIKLEYIHIWSYICMFEWMSCNYTVVNGFQDIKNKTDIQLFLRPSWLHANASNFPKELINEKPRGKMYF